MKEKKKRRTTVKGYEGYVAAYEKEQARLHKKGAEMYKPMFSYDEWTHQYQVMKTELAEDVAAGDRKQIGNVNQYIVSDQSHLMSAKQARILQPILMKQFQEQYGVEEEAKAKEQGGKIYEEFLANKETAFKQTTIRNLRIGNFDWATLKNSMDFKEFLSQEYQAKKKETGSSKEGSAYINDFFFGTSPK